MVPSHCVRGVTHPFPPSSLSSLLSQDTSRCYQYTLLFQYAGKNIWRTLLPILASEPSSSPGGTCLWAPYVFTPSLSWAAASSLPPSLCTLRCGSLWHLTHRLSFCWGAQPPPGSGDLGHGHCEDRGQQEGAGWADNGSIGGFRRWFAYRSRGQ